MRNVLEERNELLSINLCSQWRIIGFLPTVLAGEWQGFDTVYACVCARARGSVWRVMSRESYSPLRSIRRDLQSFKHGEGGAV